MPGLLWHSGQQSAGSQDLSGRSQAIQRQTGQAGQRAPGRAQSAGRGRRGGAGPVLQQPRDEARPSSDQPGGAACVQRLSWQEQTSRVSTYTIRMKKSSDHEGARQVELVLGMVHTFQNRLNAWISHVLEKGT